VRGDIPEALAAGDARGGHERSQADRLRSLRKPGRPEPSCLEARQRWVGAERTAKRVTDVAPVRIAPADDQALPREGGGGDQRPMEAGKHRHPARPGPRGRSDLHKQAARALQHVAAADLAKLPRDDPRPGAPAPRQISAQARILAATVDWQAARRRYPSISAGLYGGLARSLGSAAGRGSGWRCSARASALRFVLSVLRLAGESACVPQAMKRSMLASLSNASDESSSPTDCPKAARRPAANSSAFALLALCGPAPATNSRAKLPAASLTEQGR
jgi:hypothetical protein